MIGQKNKAKREEENEMKKQKITKRKGRGEEILKRISEMTLEDYLSRIDRFHHPSY